MASFVHKLSNGGKQRVNHRLLVVAAICLISPIASRATPIHATSAGPPHAEVDTSACKGMYAVLRSMRDGAKKEQLDKMLDTLMMSRAYQVMFKHYNRSWRPNELPEAVFKRMVLSLQFEGEYTIGENKRADTMRSRWTKFYPDLTLYESQLHQLEITDLQKLIDDGVNYAQQWLPPEWNIPNFYLPIIPNGGSPAFTIEGAQGYDFLQLGQQEPGRINLNWFVGTVAHESHHLGMRPIPPPDLSAREMLAYKVVLLCMAEGVATEFISGPPSGRVPALPGLPFHVFTPDLAVVWNEHVREEEEMVKRQSSLLARALAGDLTQDALDQEMREYWLNGAVGRAYVLGSDMFGVIYLAFGKPGVFTVLRDPRKFFSLYNKALKTQRLAFRHCVRIPNQTVQQALSIG
jgi:hypothetical protein